MLPRFILKSSVEPQSTQSSEEVCFLTEENEEIDSLLPPSLRLRGLAREEEFQSGLNYGGDEASSRPTRPDLILP